MENREMDRRRLRRMELNRKLFAGNCEACLTEKATQCVEIGEGNLKCVCANCGQTAGGVPFPWP